MRRCAAVIAAFFLAIVLCSTGAWAQAPCSVLNSAPALQPGGNVFGSNQAQWLAYFQGKVDANNGLACNLSVTGSLTLNGVPVGGGGILGPALGGTGVNNGVYTNTIGGNFSTAGILSIGSMTTTGDLVAVTAPGQIGQVSATTALNDLGLSPTSSVTFGSLALSPSGALQRSLLTSQTGAGTNPSSNCTNVPGFAFNCLQITADTSTPLTSGSNGINTPLASTYIYGGNTDTTHCTTSIACSHTAFWTYLQQTSATVGVSFDTVAFFNGQFTAAGALNGSTRLQDLFGIGIQVNDSGGDHAELTGGEVDVSLTATGNTRKTGWEVASAALAGSADTQLATWSSAYDAFAQGSCGTGSGPGGGACAGFDYGFSFGRPDSYVPVTSAGTLMVITPGIGSASFTNGIDFSAGTFSGCAFKSSGFCITGAGEIEEKVGFAALQLWDTSGSSTAGALVRIGGLGSGNGFAFQVNTASADDFSTLVTPWETNGGLMIIGEGLDIGGTLNLSGISGAGTATQYVCADTGGNIKLQSSAC